MSIPPLVCSTPPPLDQCEDDKDHEDFDLGYNLSQEDEENSNSYNFDNYTSYTNFQSVNKESHEQNCIESFKEFSVPNKKVSNQPIKKKEFENCIQSNDSNNEDLEVNTGDTHMENVIDLHDGRDGKEIIESCSESNDTLEYTDTKITNCNIDQIMTISDSNKDENNFKNIDITDEREFETSLQDLQLNPSLESNDLSESNLQYDQLQKFEHNDKQLELTEDSELHIQQSEPNKPELEGDLQTEHKIQNAENLLDSEPETFKLDNVDNGDDDFGDFDCIQFVPQASSDNKPIDDFDPWGSNEPKESDFSDFKANFGDVDSNFLPESSDTGTNLNTDLNNSKENVSIIEHSSLNVNPQNESLNNNDDDFGEFDDFQSSSVISSLPEPISNQNTPMFNLHSSENESQFIERISSVLDSIFGEEITNPDSSFMGKLKSHLHETWGHLLDVDVRQPYIVNWNNSLGQKTLLKSLCIDSRNILFGPKWNHSMPKYAVNLSVAPLQPQKPSTTVTEATIPEKGTSKAQSNWTDPFTSDGEEFTYAEALLLDLEHLMATLDQMAHSHATVKMSDMLTHACNMENETVIEAGPTDMEVFEAAVPPKSDKIFSSTLSIQPVRQISLPDTHIFTPTDSKTPRSTTIHYNTAPVVVSETVVTTAKTTDNLTPTTGTGDNDEYWEFQDFKAFPVNKPLEIAQTKPVSLDAVSETKTTTDTPITIGNQILEPIKLDVTMPTLNWPDPGEVKETFSDFSDFISNSTSWSVEKQEEPQTSPENNNKPDNFVSNNENKDTSNITEAPKSIGQFDDEFDSFQSAPSKSFNNMTSNIPNPKSSLNPSPLKHETNDFLYHNSKNKPTEDDVRPTALTNVLPAPHLTTGLMPQNADYNAPTNSRSLPGPVGRPPLLLQPTPASSSSTQIPPKLGQILEPLSLESYSQINWPNPGLDFQDLSRFNPVETLLSLTSDLSASGSNKVASPARNPPQNQVADDDIWGEFVSSKPKQQSPAKKPPAFGDDDEWTDFVSSPSVRPQNGLSTISLNVHTSQNMPKHLAQSRLPTKSKDASLDIPSLNYISSKSTNSNFKDRHFQNL